MMWRIYVMIGRSVSPLFVVGLRVHTFLTGQERARVLVFNENGEILLLRGVISNGKWSLPGGGVEKGESAQAAAARELQEETGIIAEASKFRYITTLSRPEIRVGFKVPLYTITVKSSSLPRRHANRWEISHVGWFNINALPPNVSLVTHVALAYRETSS